MSRRSRIVIVVPLICACFIDATAEARHCLIKSTIGTVKLRRGSSAAWTEAKPRMQLDEKDAIRTFVESDAELETSEGSFIKIGENSTLELAKMQGQGYLQSTKVTIMNGTILANVKKLMNSKSTFEFETPTAVASIRGTVIGFEVTGERTQIKVYEGRVLVVPQGSREGTEIRGNQMTAIVKGQKTVTVVRLEERPPAPVLELLKIRADTSRTVSPDTAGTMPADTAKPVPSDTTRLKSTDSTQKHGTAHPVDSAPIAAVVKRADTTKPAAAASAALRINLTSPLNGQKFSKPAVPVTGTATPGASITVTPPGATFLVSSSGTFSTQAPIPDEEGEVSIEVDAALGSSVQKVVRQIQYHPVFQFAILAPQDRQIVSVTMLAVKGQVKPAAGTAVTVMGRTMPVAQDGSFAGVVAIPDEEGEVAIEFDFTAGGATQTVTRTVVYKRPADIYAPAIQGALPRIAKQRQVCLAVFDRTTDDEITFFWETDGARESTRGSPNSSFCFNIEDGIHTYVVWAEDRSKNQSQRLTERIAYLETSKWYIKMRKPAGNETIRLPPSPPNRNFEPTYVVDFSIENLPSDDMRLIREVKVANMETGQALGQSTFTNTQLDFEVGLKQGRANTIVIEVQDVNGNKKVQQAVITLN